ncbi:uncharacterized protein KIAA0825 [Trichonephila clavipes]|uniref:Uncharacterized protein KIAA0825 n=1 Tax=Trichonephila clavipes TaxID=2585209 RepID=A0A8X6W7K8_TRICX|nr:uncharacterized protein KIAA0825 [Trichonephila clavipes]
MLLICYDNHTHLQDILLPVIEKTNGWQEFDSSTTNKSISERSWWYRGLAKTFQSFFVGVFEEVIPIWLDVSKKCSNPEGFKSFNTLKDSLRNHIVCVCEKDPLNSMQDEFEPSEDVISFVCLRKVLESLHRNLISLPQALKCFLLSLDLHISNYIPDIQSVHQSLPLQVPNSPNAIEFWAFHPKSATFNPHWKHLQSALHLQWSCLASPYIYCDEAGLFSLIVKIGADRHGKIPNVSLIAGKEILALFPGSPDRQKERP